MGSWNAGPEAVASSSSTHGLWEGPPCLPASGEGEGSSWVTTPTSSLLSCSDATLCCHRSVVLPAAEAADRSYPQGHMRGNCLVPGTHSRSQMSGVPRPPFSSSLCPNLCVKTHLCFLFWFCTVGRHYVWVLFSSHFPDSSGIYHCIRDCQLLSSTSHLPPCNPLFL